MSERAGALLAELVADPDRVGDIPREDLPDVLAAIEGLRARLWARLSKPPAPNPNGGGSKPKEDRLLDVEQVAEILGVGPDYVYDHADDWPFKRRISPRKLRFSERGLFRWLDSRP